MLDRKRAAGAFVTAALLLLLVGGCTGAGRPAKPHAVIVILIDAMRFDLLGLDSPRFAATPHLDALRPEAVWFTNAFVSASWTRPSVPTLFTGLYPSEHGLMDLLVDNRSAEGRALSDEAVTLAEGMKSAGYRTALEGYQVQLSPRFGLTQGFDEYDNNTKSRANTVRRFLGWLDQAPEAPFFAYLHFLDIHWPYCPPPTTRGKFYSGPDPHDLCRESKDLRAEIRSGAYKPTAEDAKLFAGRYAEELLSLDDGLGNLFAELKSRGRFDDTLIIVTADHGEELLDRGGIEHGHTVYDELLHVPFLWKVPKSWRIARGEPIADLIETRSLLPTLFDLAGTAVPKEVTAPSLVPRLEGRHGEPPVPWVAAETNGMFTVRSERWKLIVTPATKTIELYDLTADPGERSNLATSRPQELAEMQAIMRQWRSGLHPLKTAATQLDSDTATELRSLGYLR